MDKALTSLPDLPTDTGFRNNPQYLEWFNLWNYATQAPHCLRILGYIGRWHEDLRRNLGPQFHIWKRRKQKYQQTSTNYIGTYVFSIGLDHACLFEIRVHSSSCTAFLNTILEQTIVLIILWFYPCLWTRPPWFPLYRKTHCFCRFRLTESYILKWNNETLPEWLVSQRKHDCG